MPHEMKVEKRLLVVLGIVLAGLAWAGEDTGKNLLSGKSPKEGAVVAQVNGRAITALALDASAAGALLGLQKMAYRLKRNWLKKKINEILIQQEAEERGLSRGALVDEVTDIAHIPVSDAEVEDFYEDNAELFPEGKEAGMERMVGLIREEKAAEKLEAFADMLRAKARIAIYLSPPSSHARNLPSSEGQGEPPAPKAQGRHASARVKVAAEVNSTIITDKDADEALQVLVPSMETRVYERKKMVLDRMIGEVLVKAEARKRGVSEAALFESVTHASTIPIPDEEVQRIYRRMKRGGAPEDEEGLKEKIRQRLRRRKAFPQWQEFIEGLKAKAKIKIHLKPPTPPAQH